MNNCSVKARTYRNVHVKLLRRQPIVYSHTMDRPLESIHDQDKTCKTTPSPLQTNSSTPQPPTRYSHAHHPGIIQNDSSFLTPNPDARFRPSQVTTHRYHNPRPSIPPPFFASSVEHANLPATSPDVYPPRPRSFSHQFKIASWNPRFLPIPSYKPPPGQASTSNTIQSEQRKSLPPSTNQNFSYKPHRYTHDSVDRGHPSADRYSAHHVTRSPMTRNWTQERTGYHQTGYKNLNDDFPNQQFARNRMAQNDPYRTPRPNSFNDLQADRTPSYSERFASNYPPRKNFSDRQTDNYSPRSYPRTASNLQISLNPRIQPNSPLNLIKQVHPTSRSANPNFNTNEQPSSLPGCEALFTDPTANSDPLNEKPWRHIRTNVKETFHHQQPRPGKSYQPGFGTKPDDITPVPRHSYKSEFREAVLQFRQNDELDHNQANDLDIESLESDPYSTRKKKKRFVRPQRPKEIVIPDAISVANLAQLLVVSVGSLQYQTKHLLGLNFDVTPDYILNSELAALVAQEVAPSIALRDATTKDIDIITSSPARTPEEYSQLPVRAPVVTIMGHVDHGKTTLLDTMRKSAVAASEAGGITQHIGAFEVHLPRGNKITFLDTPGHSAFETMRARGANVTDVVVLVVAADDGVMPQTIEAIKHAQSANVPIIVAVNKCDKPGIDKQKIKAQLLNHNVQVEDLGGDTICVEISALTGEGLSDLEEAIVTLAELQEIRADPKARAEGFTIESQMQKGRGATATTLVKDGTLRVGAIIVAGTAWCKVRALISSHGKPITEAGPSTPVEVLGWKECPSAGERVIEVDSDDIAKRAVIARQKKLDRVRSVEAIDAINQSRLQAMQAAAANAVTQNKKSKYKKRSSLPVEPNHVKVSVIIKGDVSGSVEAVADAVIKIVHPELRLSVISQGVGKVTESDVDRAYAATTDSESKGIILGFNIQSDKKAVAWAKRHKVHIETSNVIYRLIDQFKVHLGTLLSPEVVEENVGTATVAQVYELNAKSGGIDLVAGCKVTRGSISKVNMARVVRDKSVVWQGKVQMIKHFKHEVQEIGNGNECGLAFDGFREFKCGDLVESIACSERPRTLD